MESEIRISHFCFALDPSRGGVSSGVVSTVKETSKFGISHQIFSFGITKVQLTGWLKLLSDLEPLGIEHRFTLARFKNDYGVGSLRGLSGKLTTLQKPNLVVLHQIYTFSVLIGYIYARKNEIPFVVFPHGSLTKYHESDSKFIKYLVKKVIVTKILRESKAIIVTCESERHDLNPALEAKAYHLPYGASRISLMQGINLSKLKGNQDIRIVFSGRFDKKKNLPMLLGAMPTILERYPELVLDIAGSGTANEIRKIQVLVSTLKLEKNVQFHGWVDSSKMQEILSAARLLVLPSENENFAMVVAEALSAGVPCVVSKYVGTADIVAQHHAGEVIDELTSESVADGIMRVLKGDENQYRKAAFSAVENSLDWSKVSQRWRALVTSLV